MATAAQPKQDLSNAPSVITLKGVNKWYGQFHVLSDINLNVKLGEKIVVCGPSGSGKSTLMHILAGLDTPTTGSVTIAGTEITNLPDAKLTRLRRKHIGFVFQFFNLLPMLNAE